ERRTRAEEKEKAQKIIQIVFSTVFLFGFIVPGLDKRFGWSEIPVYMVLMADIVILLGYLLIFFVFRQNSYASRVVEVDKSHKVISTGLYSIVRHPMYLGVLIMYLPTPLALGSWWGLITMAGIPLALVLRILNEEKVLCRDLPGYTEYCKKTKYRLIPFVW
ncbi:MAG: isoprenylcysteine carboxylmethyltransferase family protein, partial [Bacteroidales bacterium]|nr:isoprenylcysteine carboxylmethyltransferase family protein [Bacteroidales bacterium]